MTNNWIHSPKKDFVFVLGLPFFISLLVWLFYPFLQQIQDEHETLTWLILIVFVDVAHVYATLFKTYFITESIKTDKKLIWIPAISFLSLIILFQNGEVFFWSTLAYLAVFHFIRQQYGIMKMYARKTSTTKQQKFFDQLIIYTATIYPMLYWFLSGPKNFDWFTPTDFYYFDIPFLKDSLKWVYYFFISIYFIREAFVWINKNQINLPKNIFIIGTILSWYLGIVHYNLDIIFTFFNVICHGIPYIYLIYENEISKKHSEKNLQWVKGKYGVFIFLGFLFTIALMEEIVWDIAVWKTIWNETKLYFPAWFWVPFLSLPQVSHYILDGFIWKTKTPNQK